MSTAADCLRRGGDEKPLFDYRSLRRNQIGITKEHEDYARIDHGVNRSNVLYFHGSGPISKRGRQMNVQITFADGSQRALHFDAQGAGKGTFQVVDPRLKAWGSGKIFGSEMDSRRSKRRDVYRAGGIYAWQRRTRCRNVDVQRKI